jgi:hypothetical protein
MKPTYKNFESKKTGGFVELPPVGAYVAEIQAVRTDNQFDHVVVELKMEIIEGEYKNRFTEVWKDQDERFGNATYKGVFRLVAPNEGDEDWRRSAFEGNLWCVEQSNPGYAWDWDEKKLKGKKVGISIRKRLYTGKDRDGNPVDRTTYEIGRFETIDDVRNGKCKPMKDRDTRKEKSASSESTDGNEFTDVSKEVSVPW